MWGIFGIFESRLKCYMCYHNFNYEETRNFSYSFLSSLIPLKSYSQDFLITQLKLEFDGNRLLISNDFINKNQAEQFYVWIEMEKNIW